MIPLYTTYPFVTGKAIHLRMDELENISSNDEGHACLTRADKIVQAFLDLTSEEKENWEKAKIQYVESEYWDRYNLMQKARQITGPRAKQGIEALMNYCRPIATLLKYNGMLYGQYGYVRDRFTARAFLIDQVQRGGMNVKKLLGRLMRLLRNSSAVSTYFSSNDLAAHLYLNELKENNFIKEIQLQGEVLELRPDRIDLIDFLAMERCDAAIDKKFHRLFFGPSYAIPNVEEGVDFYNFIAKRIEKDRLDPLCTKPSADIPGLQALYSCKLSFSNGNHGPLIDEMCAMNIREGYALKALGMKYGGLGFSKDEAKADAYIRQYKIAY